MVGSPYVSAVLSLFYAVTTAADGVNTAVQQAVDAAKAVAEPDICEKGGGGYVFPLFGDDEADWPKGLRGFLYGIAVLWCFLGVAIVADLFMAAIEEITSKIYLKSDKKTGKKRVHRFWNPTVANLSLMALGSSAPEIMLNVVEVVGLEFHVGPLGTSTIVGSAAFNLLVITACLVTAITEGTKKIEVMQACAAKRAPVPPQLRAPPHPPHLPHAHRRWAACPLLTGVRAHGVRLHLCVHLAAHYRRLVYAWCDHACRGGADLRLLLDPLGGSLPLRPQVLLGQEASRAHEQDGGRSVE